MSGNLASSMPTSSSSTSSLGGLSGVVKQEPGVQAPLTPPPTADAPGLPAASATAIATPKRSLDVEAEEQPEIDAPEVKRARTDAAEPAEIQPPKVSPLFCDPEANFEIISKGGVVHRIQLYHLLANSPVFQFLEKHARFASPFRQPDELPATIDDVLCLMTRKDIDWNLTTSAFVIRIMRIAKLCKRWKCEFLLERISTMVRAALEVEGNAQILLFCATIALNDPAMSRKALPLTAGRIWVQTAIPPGDTSIEAAEVGQSCLDVAAMPLWLYELIPYRHRIALGRAYRLRGDGKRGGDGDWEKVAEEYHRLITEIPVSVPKP